MNINVIHHEPTPLVPIMTPLDHLGKVAEVVARLAEARRDIGSGEHARAAREAVDRLITRICDDTWVEDHAIVPLPDDIFAACGVCGEMLCDGGCDEQL